MVGTKSFFNTHSRGFSIATSISLSILIVISYVLIVLLFIRPSIYGLGSLVDPSASGIKPATAVTLVAALLIATTSAFVTRCVEQSLWLKLTPWTSQRSITAKESKSLAGWSVSPLSRILYVFDGAYWLLKIAGPLLVATAIVGPVLVSGISQKPIISSSTTTTAPTDDIWSGWIDAANFQYNGGDFSDVPGEIAALAYLSGLSAPASTICSTPDCYLKATISSMKATCQVTSGVQPVTMYNHETFENFTYTSSFNPEINVVLYSGAPYLYANFTTFYAKGCTTPPYVCEPGTFAVIFGAFVNNTDNTNNTQEYINTVDCLLNFGTAVAVQNGSSTPTLVPGSFVKNNSQIDTEISPLRRIYTDSNIQSPYYFSAYTGSGDTMDTIYKSAVGTLLISPQGSSSAVQVAQRIEGIFDMATLLAFSRSPTTSVELNVTNTTSSPRYRYDRYVLLILLVPLLATLLGTWGRWQVSGNDVFVGYDPVEIAKRGRITCVRETEDLIDEKERQEEAGLR